MTSPNQHHLKGEIMETETRNGNRRGYLNLTLKPMRMFNTPNILRKKTGFKKALQLVFIVAFCGTLLHTSSFHRSAKQLLGSPIYSSLQKLGSNSKFTPLRRLIVDTCSWVTPEFVDQDPTFNLFSTLIVAYPGAAKRAAYMQLEGLTQLLTGDDWFLTEHKTERYAFYKTQYPHHEGVWSWQNRAKQTVYVLQNPRTALQTYMFLVSEIKYSQGWETSYANLDRTFTLRPPVSEWIAWRDIRFNTEMHYYRWHLDYWMEQGLLRDAYTHELTNIAHFQKLMDRTLYTEAELLSFQAKLGVVEADYDAHCGDAGDMEDCRPVAIISYEHIIDQVTGLQEVSKLAAAIQNKVGIDIIPEKNRQCVWDEIVTGRITGVRDDRDRDSDGGPSLEEYEFTSDQMQMIIDQLKIMYAKYNSGIWIDVPVAQELCNYLEVYILENELYVSENFP